MTPKRAGWVMWAVLVFLIPLPVWGDFLGLVSGAAMARVALEALFTPGYGFGLALSLLLQTIFWWLLLGLVAMGYARISGPLPARFRGALPGLLGLVLLIVFFTWPVQRTPLAPADADRDPSGQLRISVYQPGPLRSLE